MYVCAYSDVTCHWLWGVIRGRPGGDRFWAGSSACLSMLRPFPRIDREVDGGLFVFRTTLGG